MGFETVYTMPDWYDGPRRGVACVNGKPHVYESCWNNIDSDEDDVFLLSEISVETLALAIEDWGIWLRWSAAFKRGETSAETHPCLPADKLRHQQLDNILKCALALDESKAFAATAIFRYSHSSATSDPPMQAEWTIITFEPGMDQRAKYLWNDDDDPNKRLNVSGGQRPT